MVIEHLSFLYSECKNMVEGERRKDLSNMYSLLKSVPNALTVLVDTMLQYIKSRGLVVSNKRFIQFFMLKLLI